MIIIETCPKCGHDLQDEIICTYPPIPRKVCFNCGWSWEGQREEIVRVPFRDNNVEENEDIATLLSKSDNIINNFSQSACINCPSNPKNGGDGICFCTLGQMNVVY